MALKLVAAGEVDAAVGAAKLAEDYRRVADELEERLRKPTKPVKVNDVSMPTAHRDAISKGHFPDNPAMMAARKAGLRSLTAVAKKLGVSTSFLSQVLAEKKTMPDDRAEAFERLTGYPRSRWKS